MLDGGSAAAPTQRRQQRETITLESDDDQDVTPAPKRPKATPSEGHGEGSASSAAAGPSTGEPSGDDGFLEKLIKTKQQQQQQQQQQEPPPPPPPPHAEQEQSHGAAVARLAPLTSLRAQDDTEQPGYGRRILALCEHFRVLLELPRQMGANPVWKFTNEVRKGNELAAWTFECLKIKVRSGKSSLRTKLLSTTEITFEGASALAQDYGGVSIEFFSNLLTSALSSTAMTGAPLPPPPALPPLFELGDSESGKLLPALPSFADDEAGEAQRKEHLQRLRLCGCAVLKSFLMGVAVGPQLARFLFDYLMVDHRPYHVADPHDGCGAFSSAAAALDALASFVGAERARLVWKMIEDSMIEKGPLDIECLVDFGFLPESANADGVGPLASTEDVDALVMRCARYMLLDSRREALDAFADGFRGIVDPSGNADALDLSVHLALFRPSEAKQLVCGRSEISKELLEGMIVFPSDDDARKTWGGSVTPPRLFKEWIQQLDDAEKRFQVFHAITSRRAVPDPHREKVSITLGALYNKDKTDELAGPNHFCKAQTCFNYLELPAYETLAQVERGMADPRYGLLAEAARGFSTA